MIAEALSRTVLLVKAELLPDTADEVIIGALRGTSVALVADEIALRTHAGQSAYVTAALLIARSGHEVILVAPNVRIVGKQPPLVGGRLIDSLMEIGADLLPGFTFNTGLPPEPVEIAILFGQTEWPGMAYRTACVSWTDWTATLGASQAKYEATTWPIGALGAAALVAGEAFKIAMRKLHAFARAPDIFDELFAVTEFGRIEFAPPATSKVASLGAFDLISGGAVANAAIYTLLRLPAVAGSARVIDYDDGALSNLNRNMMLRRSRLGRAKVEDLATYSDELILEPVVGRYGEAALENLTLRENVLMGVDDIPSRWRAQGAWPTWLGVGATDAFNVQVSYHARGLACAGCLHPTNNPIVGPIPTVAFISFWAGLILAVSFLRRVAGDTGSMAQQIYFSPLRPGFWWATGISPNPSCPVRCELSRKAAA